MIMRSKYFDTLPNFVQVTSAPLHNVEVVIVSVVYQASHTFPHPHPHPHPKPLFHFLSSINTDQ